MRSLMLLFMIAGSTIAAGACRTSSRGIAKNSAAEEAAEATAGYDIPSAEEETLVASMRARADILAEGIRAFAGGDDELAEARANAVLEAEPDNVRARDLARSVHEVGAGNELAERDRLVHREWLDDFEHNKENQALLWPSRSFWKRLSEARERSAPRSAR